MLNNNGVISKSKGARDQYAEAQTNDEKQLNEVSDWIDTKVGDTTEKVSEIVDGVPIPADFVYVGGKKDSGLVISDAKADEGKYKNATDGKVGTDLVGNQFIWIPVEKIADYKRTAYSDNFATGTIDTATNSEKINAYNGSNSEYFIEALPADEKASVEINKGYYIGRYEAGDKESTASKTLRTEGTSTSNTITVKAGQAPYNYINQIDAKSLAEGFSTKQGYASVKSKLVSSYAWNTAIEFIQKTNTDYGNSSKEGNYANTTFTYTDITGASQTKAKESAGSGTLIPTGQTTAVNNIYDMGGNVGEWTTEACSNTDSPYTECGGTCYANFGGNFANVPAGRRFSSSDVVRETTGFRITLFL